MARLGRIEPVGLHLLGVPAHALEKLDVLGLVESGERALAVVREREALGKHVHGNPSSLLEPGQLTWTVDARCGGRACMVWRHELAAGEERVLDADGRAFRLEVRRHGSARRRRIIVRKRPLKASALHARAD